MPDYNPSVALGVNANPIDLKGTIGTLSQLELAQAHRGLYEVQAKQQQRQLNALQEAASAYRSGQDPVASYLSAGGDPAGGQTLQNMFYERASRNAAGGGVYSPLQVEQLRGAAEKSAQIGKLGAETKGVGLANQQKELDLNGRVAQMILTDPSDEGVDRAAAAFRAAGGQFKLSPDQVKKLPIDQRQRIAKQILAAGLEPAQATELHNQPKDENITSRLGSLSTPMGATPPSQPGTIPAPMTPAQLKQSEGLSSDAVKDFSESAKSYEAAQGLQQRLAVINHNIATLGPSWMGSGADAKAQTGKAWNSLLDSFGVSGGHIDPNKIATWEDFNKETTRAGMELIKSNFGGSREAASIIQMGRTAVPAVANTQLGAQYVSATIGAAAQRQIDLHEYKASLARRNESLVGADVAFNKMHPSEDYAHGAISTVIPAGAKQKLVSEPQLAKQFDQQFGPGMAKYILSHQAQ